MILYKSSQLQGWLVFFLQAIPKGLKLRFLYVISHLFYSLYLHALHFNLWHLHLTTSQPSLNPAGGTASDVVLLNRWSVRNYQLQRGDIVSLVWVTHLLFKLRSMFFTTTWQFGKQELFCLHFVMKFVQRTGSAYCDSLLWIW